VEKEGGGQGNTIAMLAPGIHVDPRSNVTWLTPPPVEKKKATSVKRNIQKRPTKDIELSAKARV